MVCAKCGFPVFADANFCQKCGALVHKDVIGEKSVQKDVLEPAQVGSQTSKPFTMASVAGSAAWLIGALAFSVGSAQPEYGRFQWTDFFLSFLVTGLFPVAAYWSYYWAKKAPELKKFFD